MMSTTRRRPPLPQHRAAAHGAAVEARELLGLVTNELRGIHGYPTTAADWQRLAELAYRASQWARRCEHTALIAARQLDDELENPTTTTTTTTTTEENTP
jgi:hypothetical protein